MPNVWLDGWDVFAGSSVLWLSRGEGGLGEWEML